MKKLIIIFIITALNACGPAPTSTVDDRALLRPAKYCPVDATDPTARTCICTLPNGEPPSVIQCADAVVVP